MAKNIFIKRLIIAEQQSAGLIKTSAIDLIEVEVKISGQQSSTHQRS
jgi:hypothetical protein